MTEVDLGETIESYDENVKRMIDVERSDVDGSEFEQAGFSGTDENDELTSLTEDEYTDDSYTDETFEDSYDDDNF